MGDVEIEVGPRQRGPAALRADEAEAVGRDAELRPEQDPQSRPGHGGPQPVGGVPETRRDGALLRREHGEERIGEIAPEIEIDPHQADILRHIGVQGDALDGDGLEGDSVKGEARHGTASDPVRRLDQAPPAPPPPLSG